MDMDRDKHAHTYELESKTFGQERARRPRGRCVQFAAINAGA